MVHVACCSANLFMKLFGNVNGNEGQFVLSLVELKLMIYSKETRGPLCGCGSRYFGCFRCTCGWRVVQSRTAVVLLP